MLHSRWGFPYIVFSMGKRWEQGISTKICCGKENFFFGSFTRPLCPSGHRTESRIVSEVQWNSKQATDIRSNTSQWSMKENSDGQPSKLPFVCPSMIPFSNHKWDRITADVRANILNFTAAEATEILYQINRSDFVKNEALMLDLFEIVISKGNPVNNLSGLLLHRLLRVMCTNQDLIRREWIHKIVDELSRKNEHIDVNDLQLILDDICIVYESKYGNLYHSVAESLKKRHYHIKDIRQTVFYLHAFGKVEFTTLSKNHDLIHIFLGKIRRNINSSEFSFDLCALTIKSLANLKLDPSKHMIYLIIRRSFSEVYRQEGHINIKHISWMAEGLCRLGYVNEMKPFLSYLIIKSEEFTCLEVSDIAMIANGVQYYIQVECVQQLHLQNLWNNYPCQVKEVIDCDSTIDITSFFPLLDSFSGNTIETVIENFSYAVQDFSDLYDRLIRLCLQTCSKKVYEFQPPYRAIIFELLTRINVLVPKPIPIFCSFVFGRQPRISSKLERNLYYTLNDIDGGKQFFLSEKNEEMYKYVSNDCMNQTNSKINISSVIHWWNSYSAGENQNNSSNENEINQIFFVFIHALYYRMAAFSCQVLCIFIEGLLRINFHKVEYNTAIKLNKKTCNIIPNNKFIHSTRPMSHIIVREVMRKHEELDGVELLQMFLLLTQLDVLHLSPYLLPLLLQSC